MNKETFDANVIQWGTDRGILPSGSTVGAQLGKTLEEIGELWQAIDAQDGKGILDAVGDIDVTLVLAEQLCEVNKGLEVDSSARTFACTFGSMLMHVNYAFGKRDAIGVNGARKSLSLWAVHNEVDMPEARAHAWNEIKDRKGRIVDGVFVKEALTT